MTTTDAAQLLAVSQRTIQRWCDQGMIHTTWKLMSRPQGGAAPGRVIANNALLVSLIYWRHRHMRAVVGKRRTQHAMRVLCKAAQAARKDGR